MFCIRDKSDNEYQFKDKTILNISQTIILNSFYYFWILNQNEGNLIAKNTTSVVDPVLSQSNFQQMIFYCVRYFQLTI